MIVISMKKLTFNCTLKLSKICKGSSDKSIAMLRIFQQALTISHSRNMCWTVPSEFHERPLIQFRHERDKLRVPFD
jgi:hypothetical protein